MWWSRGGNSSRTTRSTRLWTSKNSRDLSDGYSHIFKAYANCDSPADTANRPVNMGSSSGRRQADLPGPAGPGHLHHGPRRQYRAEPRLAGCGILCRHQPEVLASRSATMRWTCGLEQIAICAPDISTTSTMSEAAGTDAW